MNRIKNSRGSITIEAAIVLPVFLFAMLTLASLISFMHTAADIESDLSGAGLEIALYSGTVRGLTDLDGKESSVVNTVLEDGYAFYKVSSQMKAENGQAEESLAHSLSPLNFIFSKDTGDGDIVDLAASYYLSPKFNFFNVNDQLVVSRARLHKWTGYAVTDVNADDTDRIVYITENGTVYHLTKTCPYLKLSIRGVDGDKINSERSSEGSIYKPCKDCKPNAEGLVYVTDYGERYHSTLSCAGLKRTIKEIHLSQVGGMKCCSKCGA